MVVQYAVIPLDPDSRETALEHLRELGEASRAEPGVVEYRVCVDAADENVVRIFEEYEDEAAVEAHMTSDHFEAFQAEIPGFVGGEVTLHKYDVSEKTQLM